MAIKKEELILIDDDIKYKTSKEIKTLIQTIQDMYSILKENELSQEMKNTLFYIIESCVSNISQYFNFDSKITDDICRRSKNIRKLNADIRDLENELARKSNINLLRGLFNKMSNAVYKWWEGQDFICISEYGFTNYGFKTEFCLDTSDISYAATEHYDSDNNKISRLQEMINEGYEFINDCDEYVLIDVPKNRELITNLLKTRFPSIEINSWINYKLTDSEGFKLRDVDCYIRNFEDIKILMDENTQLK